MTRKLFIRSPSFLTDGDLLGRIGHERGGFPLQKRHGLGQGAAVLVDFTVHGERSNDLPVVDKRHADEGERLVHAAAARAVQEAVVAIWVTPTITLHLAQRLVTPITVATRWIDKIEIGKFTQKMDLYIDS